MVHEAVLKIETGVPVMFLCSNTVGIEKGAILKMTDPMTASLSNGASDLVAGICSGEKIASNGQIYVGVYREGFFEVKLSGSCTIGDPLATGSNSNHVTAFSTSLSGSKVIGIAMETGATGDRILMELRPTFHPAAAGKQ